MFISERITERIIHDLNLDEIRVLLYRLQNKELTDSEYSRLFSESDIKRLDETISRLKEKVLWELEDLEQLQDMPKNIMKSMPEPVYEWFCSLSDIEARKLIDDLLGKHEAFLRSVEWETGVELTSMEIYIILYLQDELRMSNGLIIKLFRCHGNSEDYDGLIKQAMKWDSIQIRSLESLKWYEETGRLYRNALQAVFPYEKLSLREEARVTSSWGRKEQYELGIVIYACLLTQKKTGKAAFAYADAILLNLRNKQIYSLDELEESRRNWQGEDLLIQKARRILEIVTDTERNITDIRDDGYDRS